MEKEPDQKSDASAARPLAGQTEMVTDRKDHNGK